MKLDLLPYLIPNLAPVSGRERLRAAIGAALGVFVTGAVSLAAIGATPGLPFLIAPLGASAILLFAVSTSPLAQPWPVFGGNVISALIGVACFRLVPDTVTACAVAMCACLLSMMALRCLHPPSGTVALTAILGTPEVHELGYMFAVWPIAINSALILVVAFIFNNLTGRPYPHWPAEAKDRSTADAPPLARLGVTAQDLSDILKAHDRVIPVDPGDIEMLLKEAEMIAYERRSGGITCGAAMSRDVATVSPDTPLEEALRLLRKHSIKALPVVDSERRVIGILTQTDLVDQAASLRAGLQAGFVALFRRHGGRAVAGDIMSSPALTATPDMPIGRLIPIMSDAGHHHLPVVDEEGKLAGIVTQTDVIGALFAAEERADRSVAWKTAGVSPALSP
ncbi:MAG: HPP family protein [Parvibaculaceae bacterium]|nr:HPP family protein [Parvibaculaceae bacterium]